VSISYKIFKSYNLFYLRIEGEMQLTGLGQARQQILNDADFSPTLSQLVDLRFAQLATLSLNQIRALASSSIFERGIKRALVAPTDVEFGVSRMFEIFNEPQRQQVKVFRSLKQACEWLGVPVDALETDSLTYKPDQDTEHISDS
jgi:hypothetical protein